MSDNTDPMLEAFRARHQELLRERDRIDILIAETERWIETYSDGRTRLGKQVRRRGADGTGAPVAAGANELAPLDRNAHGGGARGDGEAGQ